MPHKALARHSRGTVSDAIFAAALCRLSLTSIVISKITRAVNCCLHLLYYFRGCFLTSSVTGHSTFSFLFFPNLTNVYLFWRTFCLHVYLSSPHSPHYDMQNTPLAYRTPPPLTPLPALPPLSPSPPPAHHSKSI